MKDKKALLSMAGFSYLFSVAMFFFVAWILTQNGKKPGMEVSAQIFPIFLVVFGLISLGLLPLGLYMRGWFHRTTRERPQEGDNMKLFRLHLILFSVSEAPAIFGLIAVILSGDLRYIYPFAGWALFLFASFWPKEDGSWNSEIGKLDDK